MSDLTDAIGRDMAEYEKSLGEAMTDCEDIAADAAGWAEPEVVDMAEKTMSALRDLLDAIGAAYNRLPSGAA